MVRAKNQPHHVRHKKSNVTDGAADGNGEASKHRSGQIYDDAHARHIHAKMHGLFFSGEEKIQIRGSGVDDASGNQKPDEEQAEELFGWGSWKDRP